eukprot:COSAG02_NODE_8749_length_2456_cov_16.335596_1_plen_77_part_00
MPRTVSHKDHNQISVVEIELALLDLQALTWDIPVPKITARPQATPPIGDAYEDSPESPPVRLFRCPIQAKGNLGGS